MLIPILVILIGLTTATTAVMLTRDREIIILYFLIVGVLMAVIGLFALAVVPAHAADFDLDKLAHAVAVAETGNCTTGMALTRNNCHGIMAWKNGRRYGRSFKTMGESFAAFKDLWTRLYGGRFPTMADARKYAGPTDASNWLANVTRVYYR
jgi:hypothetical protein